MAVMHERVEGAPAIGAPELVGLEQSLWSAFANARTDQTFLTAWLALLAARVPSARLGAVLEADHEAGAFVPRAIVPDPRLDLAPLRTVAEKALASGRPATETAEGGITTLAYPVRTGDAPASAVVALSLVGADARAVQAALRDLHWAAGWIAARQWQGRAEEDAARLARTGIALDMLALVAEHRRPEAAAMALVNELQTVLAADRVSIGMLRGARTAPRIRLLAMSYSAWFRKRSSLAESLEAAMEECLDQSGAVAVPPLPGLERAIPLAHNEHLRTQPTRHILSIPLPDEDGVVGVLTIERRREEPFTQEIRLLAESVAALIGPVLELKRRNRRVLAGRMLDGTIHVLGILLGPRRLSWKLLAVALIGLGIAAATVRMPFDVQGEAVLRGEIQRAAVVPFAGYIASAEHRAGDVVAAGAVLARLDDTDLRLEELRFRSEIDRLIAQSRDALARADRTQIALVEAQIEQARAQLRLVSARLERTRVVAPIDGIVVSGDLSQRLGAPVQQGEVLFEIAPLDEWRIDVHVDERDLRYVADGMPGRLVLAGRPSDGLPFVVTRLTPVAEAREGVNTFRLEARLEAADPGLRPGMTGVARIRSGDALVSFVWTRRLVDWIRTTAFAWLP